MTQQPEDVLARERAERAEEDLPENSHLFLRVVDAIIMAREMDPLDAYLGLNMCLVKLVGEFELTSHDGYDAKRFADVQAMMHETLDANFETVRQALEQTAEDKPAPKT